MGGEVDWVGGCVGADECVVVLIGGPNKHIVKKKKTCVKLLLL